VATKEANNTIHNNDQHIKITDLEEQMKISNSSASAAGERAQDGADHSWVVENIINKASFTTEVERQLIQHSLQSREKQSPSKKSNSKATFYGSSANEADSSSKHEDPAEMNK